MTEGASSGRASVSHVQLSVPVPDDSTICWGSVWDGRTWNHVQTGGIYSRNPIPFTGKCPHIHMVGMMSPRQIPFSSIESAVEVGRTFTRDMYMCPGPIYQTTLSSAIVMTLIVLFLATIFKMIV